METTAGSTWKQRGTGILAFVIVLLLMPLGHALMVLLEKLGAAVFVSALGVGALGCVMLWWGVARPMRDLYATLLGAIGGVLTWTGWVEFSFVWLAHKLQVQPQMVDTWKMSDDKLTWTFTLRDGQTWHDGTPVTAADCVAIEDSKWGLMSARDAGLRDEMSSNGMLIPAIDCHDPPPSDLSQSRPRIGGIARLSNLITIILSKANAFAMGKLNRIHIVRRM